MKLALLSLSDTSNIGDDIQSLAVARHIGQDHDRVDRDFPNRYDGEPCCVVMNGWFSHHPGNWPPSPSIRPISFGFHMTPETVAAHGTHAGYFKLHEPIGCRDRATADAVRSWGVDAYVSGCATMTFPRRTVEPPVPRLILVDQSPARFRRSPALDRAPVIGHGHDVVQCLSADTRQAMAGDLLEFHRDEAGPVVTTRIHCAMPCAAMGIPVVYTGVRDGRTGIIDSMGIPSIGTRRLRKTDLRKLDVRAVDFEDRKKEMVDDLRSRLSMNGVKPAPDRGAG